MNWDEPCTDQYIPCTAIVQTCMYETKFIFLGLYHVQIRYIHLHIVFTYMFLYILVLILFIKCIYQVHTSNVQVHVSMYIVTKSKKSQFEPKTSCISSGCLNHYASSVIVIGSIVTVYVYFCNWRLVTYVRRGTSRPPRQ